MPIGKDIYNVLSKKSAARRQRVESLGRLPVEQPPTVHQFQKNKASRTVPMNIHILEAANAGRRQTSPTEGMPAVNGRSGPELVKKAVAKVRSKTKTPDPTAGAIKPVNAGRKCSQCKQAGHTKRTCPKSKGQRRTK